MIPSTTTPQMSMGTAARLPITAADLAPPTIAPAPPAAAVPAQAAGMLSGPGGTPIGSFPAPGAPAEAPYDVEKQADGSAIWYSKTEPRIIIGVIPAPKLPPSLQPPK